MADATGVAPEKSAKLNNPPGPSSGWRVFCFVPLLCQLPFLGWSLGAEALGNSARRPLEQRLQILRLLFALHSRMTTAKLRKSTGNNVRISRGKMVTRYTRLDGLLAGSDQGFLVRLRCM